LVLNYTVMITQLTPSRNHSVGERQQNGVRLDVMTDDDNGAGTWEANFRQRMIELRETMEMTQTDLARVLRERFGLKFHQQIVARIESGSRPIRLNEANLIAQTLGSDLATMMADSGSAESARLSAELAQRQLTKCSAEIVVFLDDGIEEFVRLTQELQKAWDAYTSAQTKLGAKADRRLVHKGLAYTLHKFETQFKGARAQLASIVDLREH
jgi:transcriptional regulator with XRE-family HTH domain